MNILLIGNGFDLAHGLPTKYTDFLEYVKVIKGIQNIEDLINNNMYLVEKVEVQSLIEDNFWIYYFLECPIYQKENWIDFESEISRIIRSIDHDMNGVDFDGQIRELTNKYLCDYYLHRGMKKNKFGEWPGICKVTYRELRDDLLRDLNRLIRALEMYLYKLVERIPCNGILPDIQDICFDKVLSFNYTDTYQRKYDKRGKAEYDFIHGKVYAAHSIVTNNMVLGIDEERKNKDVEFIAFKKYYQRIYKETGCSYKNWIEEIKTDVSAYNSKLHNLYIFGHSLDATDKDVLRDLILCDNIYTTIFYYNKDDFGTKIANLVKVIGQDELIRRTGGSTKTIVFRQQKDMVI